MNSHRAVWSFGRSSGLNTRGALRALCGGLLLSVASVALPADATPLRVVATVPPVVHEGLGPTERIELSRGFERALRRVPGVAASSDAACDTEACWQTLADRQQAELVVYYCAALAGASGLCDARARGHELSSVDTRGPQEARALRIGVVVYSALTHAVTTGSAGCDRCGMDEAASRLQGLTESLLHAALRGDAVGSLTLQNVPPESAIYVDGVMRSRANVQPTTFMVQADRTHRIEILPKDQESYRIPEIRVKPGEAVTVEIPPLSSKDDPDNESRDTDSVDSPPTSTEPYYYLRSPPKWRWILPLVSIGAGAILLGVGARALQINGGCAGGQTGCPQVYQTNDVGFGLAGAGGGLAGMGILGLALGVQKVHARVQPPGTSD